MNKGDKVKWVDGIGYLHKGTVETTTTDFMVEVRIDDDRLLMIAYKDLNLIEG